MTNTSLKFLFLFGFVSIFTYSFSQYTLSGKLTDDNGEALIGATVKIASLSLGTSTDLDGNYLISNIANGQHNVIFSAVGFKTVSALVDFNGNVQRDVSLAEDALLLDEAVVIGYGTARTKDLTGSAVIVKSEDFNKGSVTTPEQLVMGKIPGVKINSNNGAPGSGLSLIHI